VILKDECFSFVPAEYGYIIPLATRPDVRKYWTRNTARATYKIGILEVTIDRQ
jgi:hypothetical protein